MVSLRRKRTADEPDRADQPAPPDEPRPALGPRPAFARAVLVVVLIVAGSLLLELLVVSNVQHRADQQQAFDRFRGELAAGVAPIGPADATGHLLEPGTPVAYLEIPAIGLRQVVGEGTTPATLFAGPGHRRDSVLPGQVGTTVVMGRRSSFGGPFANLGDLDDGDVVRVTTGAGAFDYEVTGIRHNGDPAPASLKEGEGRLLLATSDGRAFMPDGVLRVDARLTSDPVNGPQPLISPASLPTSERLMGYDTSTLWALFLWLQLLIGVLVLGIWAWHRWGRPQAWVVLVPPAVLIGMNVASEAARVLPNLL